MVSMNKVIVFDLDDTLYKEIEFLKSGFSEIINKLQSDFSLKLDLDDLLNYYKNGENVFAKITNKTVSKQITMDYLLDIYRNHLPNIVISNSVEKILRTLKNEGFILGLLTDGRSKTQRNKIDALGLDRIFSEVLISEEFGSEKPDERNYLYFESKFPDCEYSFIGDNIVKDFITPNRLCWQTIGRRNTHLLNIHTQDINLPIEYLPKLWVNDFDDILTFLKKSN